MRKVVQQTARLHVAASANDPDMLYAVGFQVPDPFIFLERGSQQEIVLDDLELDRGRRVSRVRKVSSLSYFRKAWKKAYPTRGEPQFEDLLEFFLKTRAISKVVVPGSFPAKLIQRLNQAKIGWSVEEGLFFPARETKSNEEVNRVREILKVTEAGIERAFEILEACQIKRTTQALHWGNSPLTSEKLRFEMELVALAHGAQAEGTIVAGGLQACDPHERGSGPLHANELIILDFFPRSSSTGYYGDLTRTVVRGRASEAQRKQWHAVLQAQQVALSLIKPGIQGSTVHEKVKQEFQDQGYATQRKNGRWQGFFHGTGHGLGLELHEPPRLAKTEFRPGQIFTVEPGLYYPEVGGVRHEDVVLVDQTGVELLSGLEKPLEL